MTLRDCLLEVIGKRRLPKTVLSRELANRIINETLVVASRYGIRASRKDVERLLVAEGFGIERLAPSPKRPTLAQAQEIVRRAVVLTLHSMSLPSSNPSPVALKKYRKIAALATARAVWMLTRAGLTAFIPSVRALVSRELLRRNYRPPTPRWFLWSKGIRFLGYRTSPLIRPRGVATKRTITTRRIIKGRV